MDAAARPADAAPARRAAAAVPAAKAAARPGEAAARVVRMEAWSLLATRLAALLNVAVALGTGAGGGQLFGLAVLLAAAMFAESMLLAGRALRRGGPDPRAGWADLAAGCAALAANAALVAGADVHTWGFFAYPYTLVGSCALGLLLPRAWQVAAGAAALALVYGAADHLSSGQPLWNAVPNGASYLGIAPVVWFVARQLRRMAAELDASRAEALELVRRRAVEAERERQSRMLHDRVLQTLETLGGGTWVADAWMRDQVRAEAAWLRWLVERGGAVPDGDVPDLASGLQALARDRARDGLRVEVRFPPPPQGDLSGVPDAVAGALLGACHEALTNVIKHAGTDRAVLGAAMEDGAVVVTVVDQGRGFDPAARPRGLGLSRSVEGRVADVGGSVRVDAAPGAGTCVELRVPLPEPGRDAAEQR
ncbi:hypothetical protein GCM10009527_070880 [Actinomadura nitritigenes]|uniref:Histidine kinase/HSP90-like ATPase domain-containing protein n=1 Tax=Actinomadura nitritigenes TaxID=134602 RepID=A0ABS3RB67_9ACTN|nr:ATP-binding protein [Actinomadura nitritigenes]MBO2442809.1 hypothetical protein [Actinomadura nitritigenes]